MFDAKLDQTAFWRMKISVQSKFVTEVVVKLGITRVDAFDNTGIPLLVLKIFSQATIHVIWLSTDRLHGHPQRRP